MSDKSYRGADTLTLPLFPLPSESSCRIPSCMPLPLRCGHISCCGIRTIFKHGPPVHSGNYLLPVTRREKCIVRIVDRPTPGGAIWVKTGGVIGATTGGRAGLEGASAGALIGSAAPVADTLAGGLIGFLSGACAGAVAGSVAGEKLDGTIFDEYVCTRCEHTFNEP